jgi:hypothetical protein
MRSRVFFSFLLLWVFCFGSAFQIGNYPNLLDYSHYLTPVRDAGTLNTRNAFAVLYAAEYQIFRNSGKKVPLSALHLYYQSGNQEDTVLYNRGVRVEDCFEVLKNQGVMADYSWPYERRSDIPKLLFSTQIAERYTIKDARPIFRDWDKNQFELMQEELYQNGPVIVEMKWPASWSESDGKTVLPDTFRVKPGDMTHRAICLTGFNEKEKYFLFKSANGTRWGQGGYGKIAYEDMRKFLLKGWKILI